MGIYLKHWVPKTNYALGEIWPHSTAKPQESRKTGGQVFKKSLVGIMIPATKE